MTNPENPTSRALRCIEALDAAFPGYTIQQAATEFFGDLLSLENQYPNRLHIIGAMDDARNLYESIERAFGAVEVSETAVHHAPHVGAYEVTSRMIEEGVASGKVVDFGGALFTKGHEVEGETSGA